MPHLSAVFKSDHFEDKFVIWEGVEKYLGDADSLLRFPSETYNYCAWLTEFLHYPELIELTYPLIEPREQIEGTHLRGNFLLATAYDSVRSFPPDAGHHWDLVTTIVKSPDIIAATRAAAERPRGNLAGR